jgi:hypothetical protein
MSIRSSYVRGRKSVLLRYMNPTLLQEVVNRCLFMVGELVGSAARRLNDKDKLEDYNKEVTMQVTESTNFASR